MKMKAKYNLKNKIETKYFYKIEKYKFFKIVGFIILLLSLSFLIYKIFENKKAKNGFEKINSTAAANRIKKNHFNKMVFENRNKGKKINMKKFIQTKAKVLEVVDGDTFKVEIDLGFDIRISKEVRVFGIDTPEIFKPESDTERVKGLLAKDRACELVLNQTVDLKIFGLDKYGRQLASVSLSDTRDYSTVMKSEGFEKAKKEKQNLIQKGNESKWQN